jgi:acyl carrier protein phosphodiesterase
LNYLAHLYLAGDDPKAQVGQVLADFVAAREIDSFEPGIRAGIRAHQRIDVFTDSHPIVVAARRRMVAPYRRYGNILLDVFFDHFLAKNWDRYSAGISLEDFAQQRYRVLNEHRDAYPGRFQRVIISMARGDWLGSYREVNNIDRALQGISRRLTRENPLADGVSVLRDQYDELDADFAKFFPELERYVTELTNPPAL